MKRRPRRVENRVAEQLSEFFVSLDLSPVERIPVLGRTGPDITINESNLAIDVKSRKAVPKSIVLWSGRNGNYYIIKLRDLNNLFTIPILELLKRAPEYYMVQVREWYDHMEEWTDEQEEDYIPALVLHRPGISIKDAVLVIHKDDIFKLKENIYDKANR